VKFILNTSLDPHFCALFDAQDVLIDSLRWTNRKRTGQIVWDFLEKHEISEKEMNFVGGISGPGGFSNLRVASGILNALSLKFDIPVYLVRADFFLKKFLEKNNKTSAKFLLNSFSNGVFYCDKNNDLVRITVEEAVKKFGENEIFTGFLPEEKSENFLKKITLNLKNLEQILLESLKETEPQLQFVPDYEFPAV